MAEAICGVACIRAALLVLSFAFTGGSQYCDTRRSIAWRIYGEYTWSVGALGLLHSGQGVLSLYADASYADEANLGCWAYTLPGFPVSAFGIEKGGSVNRLELAAVIHGLKAAVAVDRTTRPIEVHTDSQFVLQLMAPAVNCMPLPKRRSYGRVADLYGEAGRIASGRQISFQLRRAGDPHHDSCDRTARKQLREYCKNQDVVQAITLKRAKTKRLALIQEIGRTEQSLESLRTKLLSCELKISALEQISSATA